MNTLTLSIKQKYLDEIQAGTKTVETRELRPSNNKKYLQHDEDGNVIVNKDGLILTKPYDAISFLTGAHKGKRPQMKVSVESSEVVLFEDEKGELVVLTDEKGIEYYAAVIEFKLGKVIEN